MNKAKKDTERKQPWQRGDVNVFGWLRIICRGLLAHPDSSQQHHYVWPNQLIGTTRKSTLVSSGSVTHPENHTTTVIYTLHRSHTRDTLGELQERAAVQLDPMDQSKKDQFVLYWWRETRGEGKEKLMSWRLQTFVLSLAHCKYNSLNSLSSSV